MKSRLLLTLFAALSLFTVFGAANAQHADRSRAQATATGLATYAATDDGGGIEIAPKNPTATPTLPPLGTPNAAATSAATAFAGPEFSGTFTPPPTLEDLLKQFPELSQYINSNTQLDQMDLSALYKQLVAVYQSNGASGLAVFLKESGLLEKFNLPLSYLDLLMTFDKEGLQGVLKLARERGYVNKKDEILAYLTLNTPTDLTQICDDETKLGVSCYPPLNALGQLEIGIPLDILSNYQTPGTLIKYLLTVATVKNVKQVSPPIPKTTSGVMRLSHADKGVGPKYIGATSWNTAGISGKGVVVGVLDLGFGQIKDLMNGSDLPRDVQGAQPIAELTEDEEVHGTACAEVVHGAAPDAKIVVGLADTDEHFNESINFFIKNKVSIISYSVGSAIGPHDGTFGESLVVDEIVRKTGVLWVNAAGNEAENHTIVTFTDKDGNGRHDFPNKQQALPFAAFGPQTSITMNWNGNWKGGEKNEYTFTIFDDAGKEVASAAEARRGRRDDLPYQNARVQLNKGKRYWLVIGRSAATKGNAELEIYVNNGLFPDWAQVAERSLTTPADSASAFTVGATGLQSDEIETYSSQGPTADGRIKPDITAPTGEVLQVYPDGFSGTSGATPLVSGTAALFFQAFPGITSAEVRAAMIRDVVDLGEAGEDPVFGAGRIKLPDPDTINADAGPNTDATPEVAPSSTPGGKAPRATPTRLAAATRTSPSRVTPTLPPSTSDATAAITDTSVKFNVKTKGTTGMAVNVSFSIDNFKGKNGILAVLFYGADGTTAVKAKTAAFTIGRTLGTSADFSPRYASSEYTNVPLFIPNSEFGNLPKGANDLTYVVVVADFSDEDNPTLLAKSDPVPITVTKK